MRSWMKSPRMPITQIEQRCLTASEICVKNGWTIGYFTHNYSYPTYMWDKTPNLQDMQLGEIGIHLPVITVDGIYKYSSNGKWKWK